jgi:hypothetical protein
MSSFIHGLVLAASAAFAIGAGSVPSGADTPQVPPGSLTRSYSEILDVAVTWSQTAYPGIVQGTVTVSNFDLQPGDDGHWGQLPLKPVVGGVLSNGYVFWLQAQPDGSMTGTFYGFENDRDVYIEVRDVNGSMFATSVQAQIY